MDLGRTVARALAVPRVVVVTAVETPRNARMLWRGVQLAVGEALEMLSRAQRMMNRAEELVVRFEDLAARAGALALATEAVVTGAGAVTAGAATTADLVDVEVQRLRVLVGMYDEQVVALAPVLAEAAISWQPHHVRALAQVVGVMPEMMAMAEPALVALADLAPDLQKLGDKMNDMGEVVDGIPGAGLFRRRAQSAGADGSAESED